MSRPRPLAKRLVDRVADLLRVAFLGLTAPLPLHRRSALGGWLGRVLVRLIPGARRRMEEGLEIAFPDMPAAARASLIRDCADKAGRTQVEIFLSKDLAAHVPAFGVEGPGLAAIREAAAEGKGAILVSGHFGQWEAVRLYLKAQGLETGAIYRRFNSPLYEAAFSEAFEFAGSPVFQRGKTGTREMVRHLRGGGRIAILADQALKTEPFLTFFGKPARTSLAAAELALKFEVPLICVYGLRQGNGFEFKVIFEAPIPPGDPREMMQAANDSLEAMVRAHPAQWFWVHRRWKKWRNRKPPSEAELREVAALEADLDR